MIMNGCKTLVTVMIDVYNLSTMFLKKEFVVLYILFFSCHFMFLYVFTSL